MRALAHGAGRGRRGGMLHRFDWLAVLVVGIVLFELVRQLSKPKPDFVPSLILLGAAIFPATFLTFIAGRRLPADIPGIPVAVTVLLGGVIGTVVAGTLEYDTLQRLGAVPMLAVAVIEEPPSSSSRPHCCSLSTTEGRPTPADAFPGVSAIIYEPWMEPLRNNLASHG
jgi:hypothetical protein